MTETGRLHFGLKILFTKGDFFIIMEIMGRGVGQVVKNSAAATATVTVCSSRKVRTEGASKVRLDAGTN